MEQERRPYRSRRAHSWLVISRKCLTLGGPESQLYRERITRTRLSNACAFPATRFFLIALYEE